MVWLAGAGLLAAGCSSSATPTPTTSTHSASKSPSVSPGPCATVKTTTSIDQVPTVCAALWAPYDVTKVPPPDILQQEHVPPAPHVVNRTNGAVSDAEAQLWADAANWNSGWLKWAEANDQPGLLIHLTGPSVISPMENDALSKGATIALPACDLYPATYALFGNAADGNAYFRRKGLATDSAYLLVATYPGPCSSIATYPDGHTATIIDDTGPTTAFIPGKLRSDRVLGSVWYADAGGSCNDAAGPPPEWCGR